jgi:hypothetical protein
MRVSENEKIDFRGYCGIISVGLERRCFEEGRVFVFGSCDFVLCGEELFLVKIQQCFE